MTEVKREERSQSTCSASSRLLTGPPPLGAQRGKVQLFRRHVDREEPSASTSSYFARTSIHMSIQAQEPPTINIQILITLLCKTNLY